MEARIFKSTSLSYRFCKIANFGYFNNPRDICEFRMMILSSVVKLSFFATVAFFGIIVFGFIGGSLAKFSNLTFLQILVDAVFKDAASSLTLIQLGVLLLSGIVTLGIFCAVCFILMVTSYYFHCNNEKISTFVRSYLRELGFKRRDSEVGKERQLGLLVSTYRAWKDKACYPIEFK